MGENIVANTKVDIEVHQGRISLSQIIGYWVRKQPERVAIVHDTDQITWAELDAQTNALARAYAALGVKPNDFVTIGLPNSIEYFSACFATWKLGATPQPVSARLPKIERDQIIELAQPSLVVGVPEGEYPKVASVAAGYVDTLSLDATSTAPLKPMTAESFKVMTSGGSTGRPKLIVSKQAADTDPDAPVLNFSQGGCVLIPGPLYHNGPFMWGMGALFKGNTVVVTTRFDAQATLALIDAHQVDTIYMVPTMMQRVWNLGEAVRGQYSLASLRTLWHLAAPCPAWLKEAFIEWLGAETIWELYGGTEGQGSTTIDGVAWLQHKGSVGKPGPHCEMIVLDEQGNPVPTGEVGEVYMRPLTGPGSTYRYIGAEAKSIEGGWESLGDLGHFDADGYLYLSDRLSDMILSGGANIYPAEVEAAIDACPGVRSSAVIGLPNNDLGNSVHAIVDAPTGSLTEAKLLEFLADRLVRYKIPRTVEFVQEPLRDDAGKVRRKDLRAQRLATDQ